MSIVPRQNLVEQTAAHLREGFQSGRWKGHLPGVKRLAEELAVSRDTLRSALAILEKEGSVRARGSGRHRQIAPAGKGGPARRRTLRVAILLGEPLEQDNAHSLQLILTLKHRIELAGHVCLIAARTLVQLGDQPARVARLVEATAADAWIVYGGSVEVLQWFLAHEIAVLALGGAFTGLPIASSSADLTHAIRETVEHLSRLHHRRIVLVAPPLWHRPVAGPTASAYLEALKAAGIQSSEYHFPKWTGTPEGLQQLLSSLFFATPPTALILLEPAYYIAASAFLAQRNIQVPRDLSLVCLLLDPVFAWRRPELAHFEWPIAQNIRHIARWVQTIARGQRDREARRFPATFHAGGTTAVARMRR